MLTVVGSTQSRTKLHADRRRKRHVASHIEYARGHVDDGPPWLM
jgi:hypothetical protein